MCRAGSAAAGPSNANSVAFDSNSRSVTLTKGRSGQPCNRFLNLNKNAAAQPETRSFVFDAVYGPDSSNRGLYKQSIAPILQSVIDGDNATVVSFGLRGAGKTTTLFGSEVLCHHFELSLLTSHRRPKPE